MTAQLEAFQTRTHRVPLPQPETDGTLAWSATTVVTVSVSAAGETGLGWTYGPTAVAPVLDELSPILLHHNAFDVTSANLAMRRATRNGPTEGLAMLAISAADVALWDLKAKLLGVPLAQLFGQVHERVRLYGSGGFVSMTTNQLEEQLTGWVGDDLMSAVKIKVGEDRGANVVRDETRIRLARKLIGPAVELMIDANGGYDTKAAQRIANSVETEDVVWFEEPVSSDRLDELALLRQLLRCDVAAGEYGTTATYFRRMCQAGAVDCLQVDATRCGGYTGFFQAAAVADAFGLQVSSHCAPHLHAPACAAIANLRHAEYFADHVRADEALFDGLEPVRRGSLTPTTVRPGHGMQLRADADQYRI